MGPGVVADRVGARGSYVRVEVRAGVAPVGAR